jgi:hypothetical protein
MKQKLSWLICMVVLLCVSLHFLRQRMYSSEQSDEREPLIAVPSQAFIHLTTETPDLIINSQINESFHKHLIDWYANYLPWLTVFLGLDQHQPRSVIKPQATVYPHFAGYAFAAKTDARGIVTIEKNDHDQLTENHLATYTFSPADRDFQRYDVSILRHETVHLLFNHHAGNIIKNRTLDEGMASTCEHWNPQQALAWNLEHPPLEQLKRVRDHVHQKEPNLKEFLSLSAQSWRTSTPEQTVLNYALAEMFVRWILSQKEGHKQMQRFVLTMVEDGDIDSQLAQYADQQSSEAFCTWIKQLP